MNLYEAFGTFSEVAKPIIIKSDMLRLGVKLSKTAQRDAAQRNDILFKGFAAFAYSRAKTSVYAEKIPEDFYLEDGTPEGTVIQLRLSDDTPYLIDLVDGVLSILWNGEVIGKGHYSPMPRFYQRSLDGFPMASYAHAMGDNISCNVLKFCGYFKDSKNCLYCDYLPYASTQRKKGEGIILHKLPEKVAEVLDVAFHSESRFRHLMFTGGTIIDKYLGKTDVDYYCEFLNQVKGRLRYFPPGCVQIGALDNEGWKRLSDTGIPSVHSNIEVWDKRLFEIMCPGKAERVGYEEWIRRVISSVKFWPHGNINPSFVLGVEMAQPFGFKTADEAVDSTLSGYDFLMSNGVLPRQGDFWAIEPDSKLSGQNPPPLDYYLKIGKGYLELREKHGFINPPIWSCRYCNHHGTEYDFEYWHGNGPVSRRLETENTI